MHCSLIINTREGKYVCKTTCKEGKVLGFFINSNYMSERNLRYHANVTVITRALLSKTHNYIIELLLIQFAYQ